MIKTGEVGKNTEYVHFFTDELLYLNKIVEKTTENLDPNHNIIVGGEKDKTRVQFRIEKKKLDTFSAESRGDDSILYLSEKLSADIDALAALAECI